MTLADWAMIFGAGLVIFLALTLPGLIRAWRDAHAFDKALAEKIKRWKHEDEEVFKRAFEACIPILVEYLKKPKPPAPGPDGGE